MINKDTQHNAFPRRRLGEIVEFLDSLRRPIKESDRQSGPYPYYGANGQQGTIDRYIFNEPLVLLAEDGGHFEKPERGIAYRIHGKTWVNNHAHVLRAKPGVDHGFLCRILENYDVRPFISGSTRSKLTKGQAENILIPLPPLDEQKRIAAILDQADHLRRLRQRALDRLNELGQTIFHEMFGDPKFSKPTKRLGDWVELINGRAYSRDEEMSNGTPVVRIQNLNGGNRWFYSNLNLPPNKYCVAGDLLFAWSATFGPFIWKGEKSIYHYHIWKISCEDENAKLYLYWLLKIIAEDVKRGGRGISMIHATKSGMEDREILVPNKERQEQFGDRIRSINTIVDQQESAVIGANDLFAVLQRRAFRGEL